MIFEKKYQRRHIAVSPSPHKKSTLLITNLLSALLFCSISIAEPIDTIESLMTAEEKELAGIGKLSETELTFLTKWLLTRSAKLNSTEGLPSSRSDLTDPGRTKAMETEIERRVANQLAERKVVEEKQKRSQTYLASIIGDFSGWQGKTILRLDNGDIFRQRGTSKYRHRESSRRVRVSRNWAGGWELEVLSSGKKIVVNKLR